MFSLIDPTTYIRNQNATFYLTLADGLIKLTGKWVAINAALWTPLLKRSLPIYGSRHLLHGVELTPKVVAAFNATIFVDIVAHDPTTDGDALKVELTETANQVYDLVVAMTGAPPPMQSIRPQPIHFGEEPNRVVLLN